MVLLLLARGLHWRIGLSRCLMAWVVLCPFMGIDAC
jgi:hypothetical protein